MESTTRKLTVSNRFLAGIRERLSKNGFSSEDFIIYPGANKNNTSLSIDITYKYNSDYYYKTLIIKNDDLDDAFEITFSPGEIKSIDTQADLTSEEYLEEMSNWVLGLREELRSTTLGRQIHENELKLKDLEKFVQEKFSEDQQSFFSKAEGEELKEKLNKFEEMFKEIIGNKTAEHKKIHEEVELLKEQIDYLPKVKWTNAIGAKIMNWGIRNPIAAKQVGQAAVRAILPQEIENSLPPGLLSPLEEEK